MVQESCLVVEDRALVKQPRIMQDNIVFRSRDVDRVIARTLDPSVITVVIRLTTVKKALAYCGSSINSV